MKCGILILAGGKSRRMHGKNKAQLTIQGETFLSHILKQFACYEHRYLSTNEQYPNEYPNTEKIIDEYDDIGPIAGIVSAFHQSDIDAFFTIGCDMPWVNKELAEELFSKLSQYEGVFVRDDEHLYALGGIYTRAMLPLMEIQITQGDYRLQQCILQSDVYFIDKKDSTCTTDILENVNTPEDYRRLFEN